jgi:UDP-galactopyranose mutase
MKSKKIDYVIVGSGLFGSVFARQMTDAGYKCLVIDKRNHIGGNVFTENIEGINVHKYGAHIFHTNDRNIWNYVNQFAEFNNYRHKVFVNNCDRIFSFPINLMTLAQIWNFRTPTEAIEYLNKQKATNKDSKNLEDWILSQIGTELYELFVKGYTKKQWGRDPKDLPSSIIKRIPIRTNFNDFYFDDDYQGIPIGGYTMMIENMLKGIEVKTGVDFFESRKFFEEISSNIVFTGKIDEFFDYRYGTLEYRSINFETSVYNQPDFQGTSVVNYTDANVPFTRILEHKHFEFGKQNSTVITKEYPSEWQVGKEAYYPINDDRNNSIYLKYKNLAKDFPNYIFGGRLAEYRYYDMHQVIASALTKCNKIIKKI